MDSHLTGWDWFLLKPWKVQRIGDNVPCRQNAKSPSRFVDENRKWFRKSIKNYAPKNSKHQNKSKTDCLRYFQGSLHNDKAKILLSRSRTVSREVCKLNI